MTVIVMQVWWFFAFQFVDLFLFLRHTELFHPIYASNKFILFTTNNKQSFLKQEFSYASLCSLYSLYNHRTKIANSFPSQILGCSPVQREL